MPFCFWVYFKFYGILVWMCPWEVQMSRMEFLSVVVVGSRSHVRPAFYGCDRCPRNQRRRKDDVGTCPRWLEPLLWNHREVWRHGVWQVFEHSFSTQSDQKAKDRGQSWEPSRAWPPWLNWLPQVPLLEGSMASWQHQMSEDQAFNTAPFGRHSTQTSGRELGLWRITLHELTTVFPEGLPKLWQFRIRDWSTGVTV